MQTLNEIKQILDSRGLRPNKALGQNFLVDHNLIRKLVDAAGVREGDLVLEIGPGTGTMTEELLARGCRVVASELDRGLGDALEERFATEGRFALVRGDCLASKHELSKDVVDALGGEAFTLVSNLPYGAGTPALLALMTRHPECRAMAVTVQKEVAERLSAAPGSKIYGTIGVVAQAICRVERIATLPRECFWPRPDVTSAMVLLERLEEPRICDGAAFGAFCRRVFASRRKQLGSVLGRDFPFPDGVSPSDRAESLGIDALIALYDREGAR